MVLVFLRRFRRYTASRLIAQKPTAPGASRKGGTSAEGPGGLIEAFHDDEQKNEKSLAQRFLEQALAAELGAGSPPTGGHGLKPVGSGGASRISVMVTRRLAAICGSSGNSGWLSAFPEIAKMCDPDRPSSSRI